VSAKTLSIGANSLSLAHVPQLGGLQLHAVHLPLEEQTFKQRQTPPLPFCLLDRVAISGLSFNSGLLLSAKVRICSAAADTWSCFWQELPIRSIAIAKNAADSFLFIVNSSMPMRQVPRVSSIGKMLCFHRWLLTRKIQPWPEAPMLQPNSQTVLAQWVCYDLRR